MMRWISCFLFLACLSPVFSDSFSDVPPFDDETIYQVPGTLLNQLRAEYLALTTQVSDLQAELAALAQSFGEYKNSTETELARLTASRDTWRVVGLVGSGLSVGFAVSWYIK